jgi:predicted nucleic acid-binding protein
MNVIALDTNIFVYALNNDEKYHELARELIKKISEGELAAVVTYQNMTELFAVITNRKVVLGVMSPVQAEVEVKNLLENGGFRLVFPNRKTGKVWLKLINKLQPKGQRVHDYFLAATLLSNGINTLITENVDDFKGVVGLEVKSLVSWKSG